MIASMVTAAAENIAALVAGKEPTQQPDFGNSGVAFVAEPENLPRIEKYFLHKVRSGASEPG
jgi:sulfide:quinone oxidoreductase